MASAPRDPVHAKPEQARLGNDRIARAALRHRFDRDAGVPFVCECDDWACAELIRLTLPQYELARAAGDFVVLDGHLVDGADVARGSDGWSVLARRAAS